MLLKRLPYNRIFMKRKMVSEGTSKEDLDLCKKVANQQAINERNFEGNLVIGIGTGSTIIYAVKLIAEKIKQIKLKAQDEGRACNLNVVCIPSSFQSKQLICENNLTLGSLDAYPEVDWTIDGADEIDVHNNLIKGGGGCLTQEKILASHSKYFYIVADFTKLGPKFGTMYKKGVPIEVIPISHGGVKRKIEKFLGGEANLRMAVAKAGPVITDNGNLILDWKFPDSICDWPQVEIDIKMIPGVVETGLFLNMTTKSYVGSPDGTVKVIQV